MRYRNYTWGERNLHKRDGVYNAQYHRDWEHGDDGPPNARHHRARAKEGDGHPDFISMAYRLVL